MNSEYRKLVFEWQRGLSVHVLVDLVREYRSGHVDLVTDDALEEYQRRLLTGLIPPDLRLPERCGIHEHKRISPKNCEACKLAQSRVDSIKFRGRSRSPQKSV